MALGALLVVLSPVPAVSANQYVGGLTAIVGHASTEALCDGSATDGTDGAPCTNGYRLKYRLFNNLPSGSVIWVEIEGVEPGPLGSAPLWCKEGFVSTSVHRENVACAPHGAASSQFFNDSGDPVGSSCPDGGSGPSDSCPLFPYQAGPSNLTAGVKDTGSVNNYVVRYGAQLVPELRVCVKVNSASGNPFECTPWVEPEVETETQIYSDPGTPGNAGGDPDASSASGTDCTSGAFEDDPLCSGGGVDPETEEECGAWWHVACHVRSAMFTMFVPTGADLEGHWDDLYDATAGHYPLGPIIWGVGTLTDMWAEFRARATDPAPADCEQGPTLPFEDITGVNGADVKIPLFLNCPDEETNAGIVQVRQVTWWGSTLAILLGFIFGMLRLFGVRVGRGGEEES